jgi:hypothetical protein
MMTPKMTLAVMLILASSSIAGSQQPNRKPKITMEQARATALSKVPGEVKSAELEKEHGKLVYSFDVETKAGIREIQVDAYTGVIVADHVESAAAEAKEAAQENKKVMPKSKQQDAAPMKIPN